MENSKKFDEGAEHVRNAEKCLKTNFFKWKPDYEAAAEEYSKAAVCFKIVKSFSQCRDAYIKASNCYKQTRSLFQAAKCLEQVILVSKEMNDVREVAKLAEEASTLYQHHGSADTAILLLEKAANIMQDSSSVDALRLYQHAADVALMQDNLRQATEFISKTARILVKLQYYDEAVSALRREIGLHQLVENIGPIGRLAVVLVLLHLTRRDYVAAEKAFKEWGNCCEQAEVQTLETLLQAYDEEDAEGVKNALNCPFIKHMDPEYARLARDLPLPKGISTIPPPASIRPNAAPSYVSPNAANVFSNNEDDVNKSNDTSTEPAKDLSEEYEEGGLC
ncbi:gamma-soluble NSF attachment protein [Planococcus citri]|uniref:gamma-soluble NSF attachment protein n=1 Tax=Planococcus citri TaxID=170843 RepID=UPI0031F966E2